MPEIAAYVRVSTADQSLDRQMNSVYPYATDTFGVDLGDIQTYRDKSTGTDTDRDGYRSLMAAVEDGDHRAVVVHEISRMARSLQDLEATVEQVTDAGAEIHFVRDGLAFGDDGKDKPMQRLQMQMLGAFSEWQARVKQLNIKEGIAARQEAEDGYHHGRPPLGYDSRDGHLVPNEQYHDVVATIDEVAKGNLSKRKAAKRLDCGRKTITRALDRGEEMYGL